jgi:photosystem II stability/assembly factor-like uncharacterized protein
VLVPFSNLTMINSREGWAHGSEGIWQTEDGGFTWADVTPPNYFYFQYALDAQTAWATTSQAEDGSPPRFLVRTTDRGKNWTQVTEQTLQMASQFIFYDPLQGLMYECGAAAGTGICSIYETYDGGLSYAPLEFAFDPQGNPIETPGQVVYCNICGDGIYFDLDRLVIASGNMVEFAETGFPVWITRDRGQSWLFQHVSLPEGKFSPGLIEPYAPVFFGDQEGILAVKLANEDYDLFGAVFYVTQDGGQTWSFQSLIETSSDVNNWSRMDFINSQDLFFSCGDDLCVSRDGARTWQRLSANLSFNFREDKPAVRQFDFTDPDTGWAIVGEEWDRLTLWKTVNGGESWDPLSPSVIP